MNFVLPKPETLREMIVLADEKATLAARIKKIDEQMSDLAGGRAIPTVPLQKPKRERKGSEKRGRLKEEIVRLLSDAGAEGLGVLEVAAKLGVKSPRVHAWFQTTGRKVPGISKVGRGRYALRVGEAA